MCDKWKGRGCGWERNRFVVKSCKVVRRKAKGWRGARHS